MEGGCQLWRRNLFCVRPIKFGHAGKAHNQHIDFELSDKYVTTFASPKCELGFNGW